MRVLLATDGSVDARVATQWLMVFPVPPAAEVLVVAVVAPAPPVLDVPVPQAILDAAVADAQKAADAAVATLRQRWPSASTRVVDGDPRHAIPRTAAEWGADLVVVGARGLGALRRLVLGSVSTAVVRHAPCPVLVVRGRPRELVTAVIAIDGSPPSRAAAEFFAALPLEPALIVRLVGVVEPARPASTSPAIRAMVAELAARQRGELDKVLAEIASLFEPKAVAAHFEARIGSPAGEILDAIKVADLVVVGARGLGAIERLVLGSVSEHVLQHAPCPVLVVKHRERAAP